MDKANLDHLATATSLGATQAEAFTSMVGVLGQLFDRVKALEARIEALEDVRRSMGP
jgi:hypothetical protein